MDGFYEVIPHSLISLFDEYELVSVSVSGDISLFDEYELVSVSVSMSVNECE